MYHMAEKGELERTRVSTACNIGSSMQNKKNINGIYKRQLQKEFSGVAIFLPKGQRWREMCLWKRVTLSVNGEERGFGGGSVGEWGVLLFFFLLQGFVGLRGRDLGQLNGRSSGGVVLAQVRVV